MQFFLPSDFFLNQKRQVKVQLKFNKNKSDLNKNQFHTIKLFRHTLKQKDLKNRAFVHVLLALFFKYF